MLAILCSGQGRQHADMFALTGSEADAAPLFFYAAKLLNGRDPREIVRNETESVIHQNRLGQILCTLQALTAAVLLDTAISAPIVLAGYSVGEAAAWGVAGFLSKTDTLDLVAHRAEAMDAASSAGDGMLFVRGLSRAVIDKICARRGTAVAIVTPGDAFIIGGPRSALALVAGDAQSLGAARVVDVPVEVASHTKFLAPASAAFRAWLQSAHLDVHLSGGIRLFSGIDASPVLNTEGGFDKLAAQISHTVEWASCLEGCVEAGATAFIELGPGKALTEMVRGAYPSIAARSLEEFKTIDGARAWLARHRSS